VRRVLTRANYALTDLAPSRVNWPSFAEDDGRGLSETLQDGQSYLDFLQKLAERLDFEVFVEFDQFTIPAGGVAVAFHFEPARSLLPPDRTLRDVFTLRREQHLLEFTPTIKVADQYSRRSSRGGTATATGRSAWCSRPTPPSSPTTCTSTPRSTAP
jgi:hypothetical protein